MVAMVMVVKRRLFPRPNFPKPNPTLFLDTKIAKTQTHQKLPKYRDWDQNRDFWINLKFFGEIHNQGWAPRPAPQNYQNRGTLRGKIKARFSNFSNIRNQWWNNIATLKCAQFSLSIGYARDAILYILYNPILRAIFVEYHWEKVKSEITLNSILQGFVLCSEIQKFFNLWNTLFMSQISSLLLLMMMAILMVMITNFTNFNANQDFLCYSIWF